MIDDLPDEIPVPVVPDDAVFLDDAASCDWPKRTPDTWADILAARDAEEESAGR